MLSDRDRVKDRERREAAAARYKPSRIQLLLVAEAPPAGDRYFYFEDVKTNDWLFLGVSRCLLGRRPTRYEKGSVLAELRELGVFLIDLKLEPIDGSPLQTYVPDLVRRCRELRSERIVLIKVSVYDEAFRALKSAGLPVVDQRIPFPSAGQQVNFCEKFTRALGDSLDTTPVHITGKSNLASAVSEDSNERHFPPTFRVVERTRTLRPSTRASESHPYRVKFPPLGATESLRLTILDEADPGVVVGVFEFEGRNLEGLTSLHFRATKRPGGWGLSFTTRPHRTFGVNSQVKRSDP